MTLCVCVCCHFHLLMYVLLKKNCTYNIVTEMAFFSFIFFRQFNFFFRSIGNYNIIKFNKNRKYIQLDDK